MKNASFEDLKDEITQSLKDPSKDFEIHEQVSLFEGFIEFPICNSPSDYGLFAKETVPTIMLIGKSGRLYFLSLKIILPHMVLR
ncbi:MAG: hypothetical protein ACHQVS_00675 [Candidatus Babeliales bacterium]